MKKISNLEDHLGYWLRFVSNHVSLSFRKRLEEESVTVMEWVVLRLLYDEGSSPALLAEKIGITRGAMTKVLDRLVKRHFIDRTASQKDRGFQKVSLTHEGRALVPKLAKIADENELFYFSSLSEKEKKMLLNTLENIVFFHNLKTKPLD